MELVSPASKQRQQSGNDGDASKDAHAGTNLCDIYKELCTELRCKVNSAVMTQLREHATVRSLTELHLADNYVGPKGVVPIIRLTHLCQGLQVIDLRGNGLNNQSVALLSETLWNHCGIERLLLGNNPVSLDGGKRLLELVEHNDRIIDVDLAGTDIFASLIERIAMAAQRNRTNVPSGAVHIGDVDKGASPGQSNLPRLSALQNDVHRQLMNAPRAPVSSKNESTPILVPLGGSDPAAMVAGQRGESTTADGLTALERADKTRAGSRESLFKPLQPPPNIRAEATRNDNSYEDMRRAQVKPGSTTHTQRPPIPAIASMENSRLTETQRAALREKFAERAKLFKSSGLTEANKAADRARAELWLLERGVGKAKPAKEKELDDVKSNNNGLSSPNTLSPRREAKTSPREGTTQTDSRANAEKDAPSAAAAAAVAAADTQQNAPVVLESEHKIISTPEAKDEASAKGALGKASSASVGGDASALIRALAERSNSGGAEMASSWSGSFNTPALTSEERFKRLFDAGCREYALKNADAAYMAWNEAMEIAVRKPNREWIAILTTNLQRLSYELLVTEGTQQLEKQNLEQADHVFNLALNLAKKARNAEWEAEMTRAQRAVQRSVFQVRQEAATALFERARALPDEKITDNDVFVVPGTDSLTPHTEAFVNEWSRMLLIKEAVDTWSEALRVASRVGAQLGKPLHKEVHDSMDRVAEFLVSRLLVAEPINHTFSLQKTHRYNAHEINSLIDLWKNMYASAHFKICHTQFDAISSLQLGNLYLASNQLAAAQKWFELAAESGDQLFVACANTYLGIVFWQRANYATAEQRFYTGLEMLSQLAKGQYNDPTNEFSTGMGTTLNESETITSTQETNSQSSQQQQQDSNWTESTFMQDGSSKNAQSTEGGKDAVLQKKGPNVDIMKTRRLVEVLSRSFIVNMRARCFKFLVSTFAFSYRYRESLEVHERGLIERYQDSLTDQMALNFSTQPTLDHLVAIAEADQTPLVYFETAYRFKWNDGLQRFDVEETLLTWVVPPQAEMRYVQVNLTEDFHVTSLQDAVRDVRRGLRVDPLGSNSEGSRDGIVTELHTTAWVAPLKLLYTILFQPVMDFIRALDASFITDSGLLTIIPTDSLWALPFHALIFPNGKFLVEEVAVQFAFCATQTAFTQISSMRSSGMQRQRGVIVVQTDEDTWDPTQPAQNEVDFPFDSIRSVKEGERLRQVAQSTKRQTEEGDPSEQGDGVTLETQRTDATTTSPMDNDIGEYLPLPHSGGMMSSMVSKSGRSATHRQSSLKSSFLAPSPPPVPSRGIGFRDWTESPRNSHANVDNEHNEFESSTAPGFIVTDDLDMVRSVLPLSRTLHFATACDPTVENTDGSTGALCITTAQQKLGLLRASEIAQTQMYTSMVVMSQTNVRTHRTSLLTDGVLCLTRSFFAAGAVSVIFAQWCTPDMIPADFFCLLYEQLAQLDDPLQSQQTRANGARSAVREVVDAARLATAKAAAMNRTFFGVGAARGAELNLDDYKNTNSVQRTKAGNDNDSEPRAVPLARVVALVVRKMLNEGTNRYNPQRWAGYYFTGSQPMNPASIREAPKRLRRHDLDEAIHNHRQQSY